MHTLTIHYNGIARALNIEVVVGQYDPSNPNAPQQSSQRYKAIWDTGATNTVITKQVVDQCGLKPIKRVRVNTASGEMHSNVYLVKLSLPNNVNVNLNATEGKLTDIDVLIGMDVIALGDFAVTK